MTYDYMMSAPPGHSGPVAPLNWIRSNIEILDPQSKFRKKILLGLNFYGYWYSKNGPKPILGDELVVETVSVIHFHLINEISGT